MTIESCIRVTVGSGDGEIRVHDNSFQLVCCDAQQPIDALLHLSDEDWK